MTTATSRAAVLLTAGSLALTLAGCTQDASSTPSDSVEDTGLGPLDRYVEQMYGRSAADRGNAQLLRVEEITAECMREQGLEYTPVDHSQNGASDVPEGPDMERGTREFAEKYGYGATTNPYGSMDQPPDEERQELVDPNQDYVEAMSDTERQAYDVALHGGRTSEGVAEEGEPVEYDWTTAGCSGMAQHEVDEAGHGMAEDELGALREEMSTMWESAMADPRLTALNADWASCMADAGHSGLAAVGDAETMIYAEVSTIHEDAYADVDFSTAAGEEEVMELEQQIQAGVQDQLDAITPREIRLAVADVTCREEIRYDDVRREVDLEHQHRFVHAHQAELDAWLASVEAAKTS